MADPFRGVVGMETSGEVRDALDRLGWRTMSIDKRPHQSGGLHVCADLFTYLALDEAFDGGVFHPDCTYHTGSAAWAAKDPDFIKYPEVGYHQKVKSGTLTGAARRAARADAEADVRRIRYLPFPKIIENPVGSLSDPRNLGTGYEIVQPFEFGSDASKKTCLWAFDAKGRPLLLRIPRDPANYVRPRMFCRSCKTCSTYEAAFGHGCPHCGAEAGSLLPRWANQTDTGQNRLSPGENRWQVRSNTYPGIAIAIAQALTCLTGASRSGKTDA